MKIKNLIKKIIPSRFSEAKSFKRIGRDLMHHSYSRLCPICGFHGIFKPWYGVTLVRDNACPNCDSHPRQRLFWLWYKGEKNKLTEPILHFAPEASLRDRFKVLYGNYKTADLFAPADLKLNIEDISLGDGAYNTIICNHVLEHVDDRKALREMHRVLGDLGKLICSVPIIEGWETTYEPAGIESEYERELHFDQRDHIRYYGRDFRERLKNAGFHSVQEITASGEDAVKYGLIRGEKFFICTKSTRVNDEIT